MAANYINVYLIPHVTPISPVFNSTEEDRHTLAELNYDEVKFTLNRKLKTQTTRAEEYLNEIKSVVCFPSNRSHFVSRKSRQADDRTLSQQGICQDRGRRGG